MGHLIWMLILGLIAGAIAKLLMPGRDPGGWIATILLGIAGSFVGGFLARMIFNDGAGADGVSPTGLIGSVIGAMILLLIYRMVTGRRRV